MRTNDTIIPPVLDNHFTIIPKQILIAPMNDHNKNITHNEREQITIVLESKFEAHTVSCTYTYIVQL